MLERWRSNKRAESDWSKGLKYSAVKLTGTAGLMGGVRGPRLGLTLLSLALLLTWLYSRLKVCISRRRHWKGDRWKHSGLEPTCTPRWPFWNLGGWQAPWQPAPSASGWGCRGKGCCQDCGLWWGSWQSHWCRCSCWEHPVLPAGWPPAFLSAAGNVWSSPPTHST